MEKAIKEVRLSELRAVENDSKEMIVEGYAAVFDKAAKISWYTEIIDRNAFNDCDMKDVCMKYNHEDNFLILARTRNQSLELSVDDAGLKIRAKLLDTTQNKDIYKMIQAGLLDKMSFAFSVKKAEALGIELTNLQKEVIEKHSKGDYPYMLGLILKTAEICESALKRRKYNNKFQEPAKTWEDVEKILKEDSKISPRIFPYAKKVVEPLLTKKQQE